MSDFETPGGWGEPAGPAPEGWPPQVGASPEGWADPAAPAAPAHDGWDQSAWDMQEGWIDPAAMIQANAAQAALAALAADDALAAAFGQSVPTPVGNEAENVAEDADEGFGEGFAEGANPGEEDQDSKAPPSRAAAAGRNTRKSRRQKPKRRGLGFARETAIILISALVLSWLIKTFLMQAFFIPSRSMENTLTVGDRVMVSRLVPRFLDINRGDVVVFRDPGGWLEPHTQPDRGPILNAITTSLTWVGLLPQDSGEHLIKRVIGTPGDHVTCCTPFEYDEDGLRIGGGLVTVNGVPIDETLYIRPGSIPSQYEFDTVVPEGHLWVMGDNRQDSMDSCPSITWSARRSSLCGRSATGRGTATRARSSSTFPSRDRSVERYRPPKL